MCFTPVAILSSRAANFTNMCCGFVQEVSRNKAALLYPRRALLESRQAQGLPLASDFSLFPPALP